MNVSGPFPPIGGTSPYGRVRETDAVRPRDAVAAPVAPPAPAAAPPRAARAPEGATLWDLLSTEERAFFGREEALGGLTYRPGRRPAPPAPALPTGQRVDVRA